MNAPLLSRTARSWRYNCAVLGGRRACLSFSGGSSARKQERRSETMSRTISRSVTAFVSLVVGLVVIKTGGSGQLVLGGPPPQGPWAAQPSTKNGEWPHYAGDTRGTRYSPLDQINPSNFNKLEVAWRLKTDSPGPGPED